MNASAGTVRAPLGAAETALLEIGAAEETAIRLRIHDASRIEWIVAVPLPRDRPRPYQIDVELEVPASLTGRDAPWDQLQSFTRLGGPAEIASSADVTIDALRRGAVTLTRMLTRAEHIKERGRSWLTGKMVRFQSQRALRCRAPARRLPRRDVVVEAREWCRQTTRSRPDPLHPEAGGVIASHADPIPASRHRAPAAGSLECRGADAPTESADPSRDTRPAGR